MKKIFFFIFGIYQLKLEYITKETAIIKRNNRISLFDSLYNIISMIM